MSCLRKGIEATNTADDTPPGVLEQRECKRLINDHSLRKALVMVVELASSLITALGVRTFALIMGCLPRGLHLGL